MEKEIETLKKAKEEVKEAKQEVKEAKKEVQETKEQVAEAKQEIKEFKQEIKKLGKLELTKEVEKAVASRVITVITTALALVSALFWQTAINDTIKTFIPISGAWQYEILVAFIVTVAAALAIYALTRPLDNFN